MKTKYSNVAIKARNNANFLMTQQPFLQTMLIFFFLLFSFGSGGKVRHMYTVILPVLQNTAVFSCDKRFAGWQLERTLLLTMYFYIPDSEI